MLIVFFPVVAVIYRMSLSLKTLTDTLLFRLFPKRAALMEDGLRFTTAAMEAAELKSKLAYYEDLLNNLPNDLVVFDENHRYQYLNTIAVKDPVVRQFMLNKTDFDYCKLRGIKSELAEKRRERFRSAITTQEGISWQEVKEKDGKKEVISRRFKPIRDESGKVKYVLGYGLNVTELQEKENHLLEMLEEHQQMMKNSFTGIVIADNHMLVSEWNDTATGILGYTAAEVKGTCLAKYVYASEGRLGVKDPADCMQALYSGNLVGRRTEMQMTAKDGSAVWVEILIQEHTVERQKNFIVFINDIRDRKLKEREMEMLASFPRETPHPVLQIEVSTLRLSYCNKAGEQMLRFEPNGYDLLLKNLHADIKKTIQYGSPRIHECFVFEGWYMFTVAPNVNIGYVNIYAVNITEQKRTETAYAELNNNLKYIIETKTKELKESNTNLQNFAGSVSHDLRAPLRQISGYMSLLKRKFTEADTDSAFYVNEVINTVRKTDEQIKALLQLSKVDTEAIHQSLFCIQEVFDKAVDLYKSYYHVETIDYRFNGDAYAYADVSLLGVVIDNLISNAIKYSSERECVRLRVSAYKEDGMQVFCVEDNGTGFDMKYYEKIFGVFQRLHSHTQFDGMGIGLTFVKKIINKHRGRMWAESREGEGTKFFFSIPLKSVQLTQNGT